MSDEEDRNPERIEDGWPRASPGWKAPCCDTCRFWTRHSARITSNTNAECRRHAPTPLVAHRAASADLWPEAIWPIVECDDWCGDHMELPEGYILTEDGAERAAATPAEDGGEASASSL